MQHAKYWLVFALAGLGACGADADGRESDRDLERLRSLGAFEVRYLVVDGPGASGDCSGQACPPTGRAPSSLNSRVARRLARLADLADLAAEGAHADPSAIERVEANLALLRSLEIVEVGDFIRKQPSNNPRCNDTPCQTDIEAADSENEANAAVLEAIAVAAARSL
jgi:hypothetical protein